MSAAPPPRVLATFTVDRTGSEPVNTYAWRVPNGIRRVRFEVFGAGGQIAANGGKADATYAVTPGQVFQIVVGGEGDSSSGGLNGGGFPGGAGASDVRVCADAAFKVCDLTDRFVVAGGGGFWSGAGGAGGGAAGQSASCCGGRGGGGGTQTAGGTAGLGASPGTFGFGGSGLDVPAGRVDGGGGGGGWYGGGGGGEEAGGGGGSGYISPVALSRSLATGVWSGGDGKVVIYKA